MKETKSSAPCNAWSFRRWCSSGRICDHCKRSRIVPGLVISSSPNWQDRPFEVDSLTFSLVFWFVQRLVQSHSKRSCVEHSVSVSKEKRSLSSSTVKWNCPCPLPSSTTPPPSPCLVTYGCSSSLHWILQGNKKHRLPKARQHLSLEYLFFNCPSCCESVDHHVSLLSISPYTCHGCEVTSRISVHWQLTIHSSERIFTLQVVSGIPIHIVE